jgi:hypothetical protein
VPLAALLLLLVQSDSVDLVRSARRAQAEFEQVRLALLPPGRSRSGGRCDVSVGRYCYWSDGPDSDLPREPAAIGTARAHLVALLDSVSSVVPGDAWVAGQRVRYLLEAGETDAALRAADACAAERWWCTALAGLVRHVAGDFATADRLFEAALDAMPPAERCRWTDLSDLLDGRLRRRYRKLSCDDRPSFNARIWWLAQPLWSMGTNDRRTEHYARVTMARLWSDARSLYGFWGADQRALLVRYGWPVAWERDDGGDVRQAVAIGHEPEPSYHFVPDAAVFDAAAADTRSVARDRQAVERYAPEYAAAFTPIDADFATFRRGESTLVVATWDVSGDTVFAAGTRDVALVLARDPATPFIVARRPAAASSGVLVAEAPWTGGRSRLEVVVPERRAAGRARRRLAVPVDGVALSGILLFEPGGTLPVDLDVALRRPLAGPVERGGRIGLYWEAYGLAPEADVPMAVHVAPEGTSLLRRLAGMLHLAARPRALRIAWHEVVQPVEGRAGRALVLDLGGLDRGRYRIEVTVTAPSGAKATATREVRVIAP